MDILLVAPKSGKWVLKPQIQMTESSYKHTRIHTEMDPVAAQPTYTWYRRAGSPGNCTMEGWGRQSRPLRWSPWSWERNRFYKKSNFGYRHRLVSTRTVSKATGLVVHSSYLRLSISTVTWIFLVSWEKYHNTNTQQFIVMVHHTSSYNY